MSSEVQKQFARGLNDLSDFEMRFLLAYCGIDPPGKPRTTKEAYLICRPGVKTMSAQSWGRHVLARIRQKGALSEFFEQRNLGINRAIDLLQECSRAELVKIIQRAGGAWDYAHMPDFRTRLRAARMLLEVHGVVGPEALVNINVDARPTWGQQVAEQAEAEEQKRLAAGKEREATDAEFTETEKKE